MAVTPWEQRFNEGAVWTLVDQCLEALSELELEDKTAEERQTHEASVTVLEQVRQRREETDPRQVSTTMLSRAEQAVTQLNQGIAQWKAASTPHTTVMQYVDAVIDSFAGWPPLAPSRWIAGINKSASALAAAVDESVSRITEQRDSLVTKLEETKNSVEEVKGEVATERQRITEAIAEFTSSSETRVQELVEDKRQELEAERDHWATARAQQADEAESTLTSLRGLESEARNVVHATTAAVVASDYGQYARNKSVAAWVCDVTAAVVGATGVGAILYHLYQISPDVDGDLGVSLTRLAGSLGTIGIAGLVGKRGQQHHREARAAKRTDLALRKIGPFTANLPEEEQKTIIREITNRIFIRGELDEPAAEEHDTRRLGSLIKPREVVGDEEA